VAQAFPNARTARLSPQEYVDGILNGDRAVLARAITLVESVLPEDAELSEGLLAAILPLTGQSRRIGITGVPGVGKSTFIDALGMHMIHEHRQKVAVLSVDPSSPISGGSILGDRTRMERLSVDQNAFIRSSPARGHLGGVARHTRETILLCEAAGYQNILVETIGVGQSEIAVRSMTDFFLLLMLAGAGDELQGIKRGILEMIDCMVINKADGDNVPTAEAARVAYSNAMHLFPASPDGWTPPVLTISSLTGKGIPRVWDIVLEHRARLEANGYLAARRKNQALEWMRELVSDGLTDLLRANPTVASQLPQLEDAVRNNQLTPTAAARALLSNLVEKEV
jgi:LAO/AO transport system kinase